MNETPTLQNGKALPRIDAQTAKSRRLLSGAELERLGLSPGGAPVACFMHADGEVTYYFDPNKVTPAEQKPVRLKPCEQLPRLRLSAAIKEGYYPKEALRQMYYEPTEQAVAYCLRHGQEVLLYDKWTCRRLPLPCAACGDPVRYRAKLCRACYEKQLAARRAEGDARRAASYGMRREKVLFFDLEMTGVYFHDEVLSITIVDGNGRPVLDTLVRPVRKKKWKATEAIHGITPDMVCEKETFAALAPRLREIFAGADRMIAFGTSTDFFHLSKIYESREERNTLHDKIIDCATEFSRYVKEHEIELSHHSLSDAMATFGLDWHGTAHSSTADTDACRRVFETLFPHFFKEDVS